MGGARRGFTLIDVLVSISVIGILIGILLPRLSSVHETARRTVCRSNVRQIGLGMASFADEQRGMLPGSVFKPDANRGGQNDVEEMIRVRLGEELANEKDARTLWDGLGLLHIGGYLPGPKVYYCPSHRGEHQYRDVTLEWGDTDTTDLFGNYHYRGSGPNNQRQLFRIEPARSALVADGMRTLADYNHGVGANVLRADMSTEWIGEYGGLTPVSLLRAMGPDGANTPQSVDDVWRFYDTAINQR